MANIQTFTKLKNNILYRMVIENNHKFDAAVLPAKLINTALFLGHNQSGHNGFPEKHMQQSKESTTGRVCTRIF